jgi:arginine/lysine/ornithine decarboxylase
MAGEVISQDTLNYLKKVIELGGIITGAKDSTLKTIQLI